MPSGEEVDPDASTSMPADRQEDLAPAGFTAPVTVVFEGEMYQAKLVSLTDVEMVVEVSGRFEMDAEVSVRLEGRPPVSVDARVMWTRNGKGPTRPALGLTYADNDGLAPLLALFAA